MEQMTFLDFFAGIGGFRKGFELCGMRCVGHCEIDKYADRSYRAIHDVKEDEWYAADITKVAPADLPRADLWAGGFPCQDISVAGRQRGLDGARSGLFFTLAQLVKGQSPENRPTWIVLENVKNLLSIHGGWDFATVLDTLASLGYRIEYGLLNTKYFGPPQNRERVFIVACRHPGAGRGPKIFPVPAGSGKALIQLIGGMQGQRVYDPAGISVTMAAQSGGWGGKTGLYFVDLCNGNPKLTDHARCIKAKYYSGITNRGGDNSGVLISPAGMDKDAVLSFVDICTGKAKLTREARCILSAYNRTISNWGGSSGVFYGCRAVVTPDREEKRQNGRRIKNCGEPSFTVTAQDRHGVLFQDCDECPYGMQIREATKKGYDIARCGDSINLSFPESKTRRGRVGKDLATTLETSCNQGTAFAGCGLIRRLTPRECWRLQGFTDEMFDKARAVNSDNQLYRQAGNSVTVPVIYAIGKQILAAQKDKAKNKSSLRTYPLIPFLKERLLEAKKQQEENRKLCGRSYNKEYLGYVCVDVIGNLIKPNYVSSTFGKLLAKNNLRHIRFHDLRHTCASLLLANGVPMEQVKEWLGHSEISTTVDIYGHLQYATKKQSAAAIEQDIVAPMLQNLSAVSP